MSKVSAKAVEASNLLARLQGIDTSTASTTEEVEIEFEDEPKKKEKTATKGRSRAKQPVTPKQPDRVPDLDVFKALRRNEKLSVQQNQHDIHYKEQIWGIPSRTITYNLEVISNPKVAKDTAILFKLGTPEDLKQAESGEVRYLRIVSYENIPYRSREIGYVRVISTGRGLSGQILLKNKEMKENNINPDQVKRRLNKQMDRLLGKVD